MTRGRYDPMAPMEHDTWLVIRDEIQRTRKIERIPAGADPEKVMAGVVRRSEWLGFEIEEVPGRYPLYFCRRGDERRQVGIEERNPLKPSLGHG